MRVLLVGQGRWVEVLRAGLAEYAAGDIVAEAWSLDTPALALSPAHVLHALRSDVIVRVGFRPGARTRYGRGFDWLWQVLLRLNPRARAFVYWIGTDVHDTLRDAREGLQTARLVRLLRRASSIAGSGRLVAELEEADIQAALVPFPGGLARAPEKVAPLPDSFTVLSYVPDARPVFYGGPQILDAARAIPAATFLIVGGEGSWASAVPDNVRFLGWVEDMASVLDRSTAVVRLVEHDSVGGTAIEALLHARHLIYSYALPHATFVPFGDSEALTAALTDLLKAHD